jgi:hypothetical protein
MKESEAAERQNSLLGFRKENEGEERGKAKEGKERQAKPNNMYATGEREHKALRRGWKTKISRCCRWG